MASSRHSALQAACARLERAKREHAEAAEAVRTLLAQELKHAPRAELSRSAMPSSDAINKVIATVAQRYGVTVADLKGRKMTRAIAQPRIYAMTIARQLIDCTYQQVADAFHRRDHGTIMSAEQSVRARCETEPAFAAEFRDLTDHCATVLQRSITRGVAQHS